MRQWLDASPASGSVLLLRFELVPYWLQAVSALQLTAVYLQDEGQLRVFVTDADLEVSAEPPCQQFGAWAQQLSSLVYTIGAPLAFAPHIEAKPWGREIWYTGVEQRGVCRFVDPATQRLLGGGIVGPQAGDLISEVALALEMAGPTGAPDPDR